MKLCLIVEISLKISIFSVIGLFVSDSSYCMFMLFRFRFCVWVILFNIISIISNLIILFLFVFFWGLWC